MLRVRRRNRRTTRGMTDISLTPLIDTVLTLLIIFMMTAPVVQRSIKVNLPQANVVDEQKQAGQPSELTVVMDEGNALLLNGTTVSAQVLVEQLKERAQGKPQRVSIRADRAVSYGKVIELVDLIKASGAASYVALAIAPAAAAGR